MTQCGLAWQASLALRDASSWFSPASATCPTPLQLCAPLLPGALHPAQPGQQVPPAHLQRVCGKTIGGPQCSLALRRYCGHVVPAGLPAAHLSTFCLPSSLKSAHRRVSVLCVQMLPRPVVLQLASKEIKLRLDEEASGAAVGVTENRSALSPGYHRFMITILSSVRFAAGRGRG